MTGADTRPAGPLLAPRRAVRVGAVPAPRLRPLAEVLAGLPAPRSEPAPVPAPARDVPVGQDELDHLARALRPVAARLLTAVVEVLDGRRPPAQLAALVEPEVLARLTGPGPGAHRPDGRLRGLRVCTVGRDAAEVCAVVVRGERARAVACRLERPDDAAAATAGWRLTLLVLG